MIYLDNAATTKPCAEAAEALVRCMTEQYGNPSSLHRKGLEAQHVMEHARQQIAAALGCKAQELLFTSGATESTNLALRGAAAAHGRKRKKIITSAVEHASVRQTLAQLEGKEILATIEGAKDLEAELMEQVKAMHDEHEHHHDHDEDHDHEEHCCCGHHHHDDDDDEDEHEHHHEHGDHCCCGHHHHHHDHDADEVFTSWGVETARKFTKAEVEHALTELDTGNYGMILRSKGIVDGGADGWLEFDYVPGEWEVRSRSADVGGKLVVIGSKLNETAIAQLFGC